MRPLMFGGLSVPREQLRDATGWTVEGPVAAGDLDAVPAGSLVGIADGLLEAEHMLPVAELRRAIVRGVEVHGAASLGALLAAELTGEGISGHGWVYQAFRSGLIEGTDEIAVLYDPQNGQPLTIPLVSFRFCLEALAKTGRLSSEQARDVMTVLQDTPLQHRDLCSLLRRAREQLGPECMRLCLAAFPEGLPNVKARDTWNLVRHVEARARSQQRETRARPILGWRAGTPAVAWRI